MWLIRELTVGIFARPATGNWYSTSAFSRVPVVVQALPSMYGLKSHVLESSGTGLRAGLRMRIALRYTADVICHAYKSASATCIPPFITRTPLRSRGGVLDPATLHPHVSAHVAAISLDECKRKASRYFPRVLLYARLFTLVLKMSTAARCPETENRRIQFKCPGDDFDAFYR